MGRKVIKILPHKMIFTGKIESWLSDMAKSGLILKKIRLFFAVFDLGEPEDIAYRVTASGKTPDEDTLNKIESNGWKLVSKDIGVLSTGAAYEKIRFMVFECRGGQYENDLSDDFDYDFWLKKRWKIEMKQSLANIILVAIIFVLFAVLISKYFFMVAFIPLMDGIVYMFVFTVLWIFAFANDRLRMKPLKKEFESKETIVHIQDWKISKSYGIIKMISFVFVFLMLFTVLNALAKDILEHRGTDLCSIENVITLSIIEDTDELKMAKSYQIDEDNFCGCGYKIHSIFAPQYYYAAELGTIRNEYGTDVSRMLKSRYIETFSKWYAYQIFKNETEAFADSYWPAYSTSSDEFEHIAYIESSTGNEMWFLNGNTLVYLNYMGRKDPDEVIAVMDEVFAR